MKAAVAQFNKLTGKFAQDFMKETGADSSKDKMLSGSVAGAAAGAASIEANKMKDAPQKEAPQPQFQPQQQGRHGFHPFRRWGR